MSPIDGLGMLWYDNTEAPLTERVQRAMAYFKDKYGTLADTCCVPPGELDEETVINGVRALPLASVLPGHLWIGRAAE